MNDQLVNGVINVLNPSEEITENEDFPKMCVEKTI